MNILKMLHRVSAAYRYIATFLLTSILLLVVGNYVLGIVRTVKNSDHNLISDTEEQVDQRAYLSVYDDFPEKERLWKNHPWKTHFEPYIHWRRDAWKSKYVNVDESGIRRTVKTPQPGAKKVFVFGGSTIWGTGSPDEMTIPSYLQQSLGNHFDVYNFGETGFVAAQELNLLLKLLADGQIPDVVIFYDGNNDGYAGAYSPAVPRDPQNLRQRSKTNGAGPFATFLLSLYQNSYYKNFVGWLKGGDEPLWDQLVKGREVELSQRVLDYYQAHIRQVKALGREYGFKSFFFWQPHLLNSERKAHSYEASFIRDASPVFVESQHQVYLQARRRLSGQENADIFFLGDILNEADIPAYLDWSHTGPQANALIAREMYERMKDDLPEADSVVR